MCVCVCVCVSGIIGVVLFCTDLIPVVQLR